MKGYVDLIQDADSKFTQAWKDYLIYSMERRIPARYLKFDVEKFPEQVNKLAESIDKIVEEGKGIVFSGAVGTGKSMSAAFLCVSAIVKRAVDSLDDILFVSYADILNSFIDDNIELDIISPKLLVIDDYGRGYESEYHRAMFEAVFSKRYDMMKSTIITTNLSRKEMLEMRKSPEYQRLMDRILDLESFLWIPLKGGTKRRVKDE